MWNEYIAYNRVTDQMLIGIKGTTDWRDWKINLDFNGQTHEGFGAYTAEIYKQIGTFIKNINATKSTRYVLLGHSLGAASVYFLASILCYWQLLNPEQITLRTYALPKNMLGDDTIIKTVRINHPSIREKCTITNYVEKYDAINVLHYGYAKDPIMKMGYEKTLRNMILKKDAHAISIEESKLQLSYWPHFLDLFPRLIVFIFSCNQCLNHQAFISENNKRRSRFCDKGTLVASALDIFKKRKGNLSFMQEIDRYPLHFGSSAPVLSFTTFCKNLGSFTL